MGSNGEKSNIAIAILKKLPFLKGNKIILHLGGSNNIFADCTIFVAETPTIKIKDNLSTQINDKPSAGKGKRKIVLFKSLEIVKDITKEILRRNLIQTR